MLPRSQRHAEHPAFDRFDGREQHGLKLIGSRVETPNVPGQFTGGIRIQIHLAGKGANCVGIHVGRSTTESQEHDRGINGEGASIRSLGFHRPKKGFRVHIGVRLLTPLVVA